MHYSLGLVVILALVCFANCKPNRVPWWQIKVAKSQGPNACIVEEVPDLSKKYYTECKYWPVRKVCGRETIVRYECCEGFKQVPGEEGCTGVKALKNVLEVSRDFGATKFVKYLEDSGLGHELTQEGTYTLFAPTDQAFESPSGQIVGMKIESFLTPGGENPVLRYHISDKKYLSKDFSGNNEIKSLQIKNYDGRQLRISKYSIGVGAI
ncbi:unnamed protein product [Allacma fusca]|uniref:FAS1 domain-containing protein n=1 Tax=Allacma fusca TaxID=39272 RepID=A0A8J2JVA8_9HEXA|nr:unnamed protein product [Allacma fusca]